MNNFFTVLGYLYFWVVDLHFCPGSDLMETILLKIGMDNLIETILCIPFDGNYTFENWYGQFD